MCIRDSSRNAAHVGVGLDAALIPAAYHPARAALGPLGRSVLLHRLFRNLGQFHNGFPGLVKLCLLYTSPAQKGDQGK